MESATENAKNVQIQLRLNALYAFLLNSCKVHLFSLHLWSSVLYLIMGLVLLGTGSEEDLSVTNEVVHCSTTATRSALASLWFLFAALELLETILFVYTSVCPTEFFSTLSLPARLTGVCLRTLPVFVRLIDFFLLFALQAIVLAQLFSGSCNASGLHYTTVATAYLYLLQKLLMLVFKKKLMVNAYLYSPPKSSADLFSCTMQLQAVMGP